MSVLFKFILVILLLYYVAKFALKLMLRPVINMQKKMFEEAQRQQQAQRDHNRTASDPEGKIRIDKLPDQSGNTRFDKAADDEYIEYEDV